MSGASVGFPKTNRKQGHTPPQIKDGDLQETDELHIVRSARNLVQEIEENVHVASCHGHLMVNTTTAGE